MKINNRGSVCKTGRRPDKATVEWLACIVFAYLRGYKYMNHGVTIEEPKDGAINFTSFGKRFRVRIEEA